MKEREQEGLKQKRNLASDAAENAARTRVVALFALVVVGVLAAWFWDVGSAFIANKAPDKELQLGSWAEVGVRAGLAAIVGFITFPTIYEKIGKSTGESWIAYFLAFQNGFFWQSVFEGVKETIV